MFIAALIIYFKPEYAIIDPICTFVFSFIVLLTTIKILKDAFEILMEATPSGLRHNMVIDTFLSVDGIRQVHNLRTAANIFAKISGRELLCLYVKDVATGKTFS